MQECILQHTSVAVPEHRLIVSAERLVCIRELPSQGLPQRYQLNENETPRTDRGDAGRGGTGCDMSVNKQ